MTALHAIDTRPATVLDAERVGEIVAAVRGPQWRALAEAHCHAAGRWIKRDGKGQWCRCWVASCDGQVAGVAWATEGMTCLSVSELCVLPGLRGRYLGTALLLQAQLHAEEEQIPALVACRVEDRAAMAWLWRAGLWRVRRECGGELLTSHYTGGMAAVYSAQHGIRIAG